MAQHGYVINDGTGSAVLTALNLLAAAIQSGNSGSSAPASTAPGMPWYDTSTGLLNIRNAADDDWITLFDIAGIPYSGGVALTPGTGIGDIVRLIDLGDTDGTPALPALNGSLLTGLNVANAPFIGTAQATSSGTFKDFTGIPSWVTQIVVTFNGVSTDSSADLIVQLGDAGGIETSSYVATGGYIVNAGATIANAQTTGFPVMTSNSPSAVHYGELIITKHTGNTWTAFGGTVRGDNQLGFGGGTKALSDTLTQVRVTTVGGTANFDGGGAVNIRGS